MPLHRGSRSQLNRPRKSERRFSSLLQALAADLASKDDEHLFEAVIRESRSLPLDQLKDGERGRRRSMLQEQLVELKTARKQLTKMVEADSDLSLFVTRQLDGLEGRCSSLSRRMNASMMAFEAVPARFGEDAHMRIAPEAFFGLLDSVVPVLQVHFSRSDRSLLIKSIERRRLATRQSAYASKFRFSALALATTITTRLPLPLSASSKQSRDHRSSQATTVSSETSCLPRDQANGRASDYRRDQEAIE